MKLLKTEEIAKKWGLSERSVRHYCNCGRIPGAVLSGKTWLIPENAEKPARKIRHSVPERNNLLRILKEEKDSSLSGGIYHCLQIEMTYNSNHIEGSRLSHDQTRYIFETHTIGKTDKAISTDDIIETTNHFRCIDIAIDVAKSTLTESLIKQFHFVLKTGTSDASKSWFNVGNYKLVENEVGGKETTSPQEVTKEIRELLKDYNSKNGITFEDIIQFHAEFEAIHPFQDGNGRVGRLIMFKECLKHNIIPVTITDEIKEFYYRGLREWNSEKGYLLDTCRAGQDITEKLLDRFKIGHQ